MRLLTLNSIGSFFFLAVFLGGCADLHVAKEALHNNNYELAQKHYQELAKRGFPRGYKGMGDLYLVENPQDTEVAFDYYMKAYRSGYEKSASNIASIKYANAKNEKEFKEAYRWLKIAKKNGSKSASYKLAVMRLEGKGTRQNINIAIKELDSLANNFNDKACMYLANLYENGLYAKKSDKKALYYYAKAYTLANEKARIKSADIYANKLSSMYNLNKAKNIYEEFANKGNIYASFKLAKLYAPNSNESIYWYKKASELNYFPAVYKYAQFLFEGIYVKQDLNLALEKFQYLSASNYHSASSYLANIYALGLHVEQNITKSIKYYELAFAQGDENAKLKIANIYANKDLDVFNKEKAIKIYSNYANKNNIEAMYKLARLLESENGLDDKSYYWYEKSANLGFESSKIAIADMKRNGKHLSFDIDNAIKEYKDLKNNSVANSRLGDLYFNGFYVKKNLDIAMEYYKKAYILGFENASYKLGLVCEEKKDLLNASKWYEKSVSKEFAPAQYRLAIILEKTDLKRSNNLLKKSATQEYANAQLKYGENLFYANGIEKDQYEGLKFVFKSIKNNNSKSVIVALNLIEEITNLNDVNRAYNDAKY